MGRFKREVRLFGREFKNQILGSGKKPYNPRNEPANRSFYRRVDKSARNVRKQYNKVQRLAKRFK